ncbi:MAG: glycine--tRNA ligase [Nitrososphaerota archaeon]
MPSIEEITKYALQYGFFYPTAEIYSSSPAGFWDYGPLGALLKHKFIQKAIRELIRRDEMILIDGSQILPKEAFIASGHLDFFTDPVCECRNCNSVYRADKLLEEELNTQIPERTELNELNQLLMNVKCPRCGGELKGLRLFNMMFKVNVGVDGVEAFLRPETAQNIFTSFRRLHIYSRGRLPLAVAQIGKSFRNEISPRQSLLRMREFTQLEIEVFHNPKTVDKIDRYKSMIDRRAQFFTTTREVKIFTFREALEEGIIANYLQAYYLALIQDFYLKIGIPLERIRFRELGADEKAFYATKAWDLEVLTDFGWIELVACNDRGDYDLSGHMRVSNEEMYVIDEGERIIPHVFELSMGVDRSIFVLLASSLEKCEDRHILRIDPELAPITVAVLPLVKHPEITSIARNIFEELKLDFDAVYDDSGSIGRRYRRQDIIGTPYCITIDFETINDGRVTVRDRDTMEQERVEISRLKSYLYDKLRGNPQPDY